MKWKLTPEIFRYYGKAWDICQAKTILSQSPREPVRLDVRTESMDQWAKRVTKLPHPNPKKAAAGWQIVKNGLVAIDWEKVDNDPSIDVTLPCIGFQDGEDIFILDGWHRIAKSREHGPGWVLLLLLTPEEEQSIRV